ncbi:MAG: hypothetical protein O7A04_04355, partial [Acidobacteria bacterium]|nr:hypothetical protein [Acidobacteriota bacterium]
FDDADSYLAHLSKQLPDAYRASSDFQDYAEKLRKVAGGEVTAADAAREMPTLRRVGGACPCSKSVRWVADNGASGNGGAS